MGYGVSGVRYLPLLVLLVLLLCRPMVQSQAAVGQDTVDGSAAFIEALAAEAIAILQSTQGSLQQREDAFRVLLARGFDMNFIGRFVLGKHWRRASAEQRADYLSLFQQYILGTYSRRFGGYAGETFTVMSARAVGRKDVLVATRINQPSGPPILADWRVRVIDGQYKIIDVIVEGVSMAVTQRAEFSTVVSQHGMEGLLQALRARTQMFQVAS